MSSNNVSVIYFRYRVTKSTGELVETSGEKTVSILQGANQTFKVIEQAMLTSVLNEKYQVEITAKQAYGDYDSKLVFQVPESKFEKKPQMGSKFKVKTKIGEIREMWVVDQKDDLCILDGNHPLAGVSLLFEFEVSRRRPAQQFEIQSGRVRPVY